MRVVDHTVTLHADHKEAPMQARKLARIQARKRSLAIGFAVAVLAVTLGARALHADIPGFKRVELQKHDIANAGHEAVLARGEFNPGAAVPKHTHPGEEVAYILEGQILL